MWILPVAAYESPTPSLFLLYVILHSVQIIFQNNYSGHATFLLKNYQWLLIAYRVMSKVLHLVSPKSLKGSVPLQHNELLPREELVTWKNQVHSELCWKGKHCPSHNVQHLAIFWLILMLSYKNHSPSYLPLLVHSSVGQNLGTAWQGSLVRILQDPSQDTCWAAFLPGAQDSLPNSDGYGTWKRPKCQRYWSCHPVAAELMPASLTSRGLVT